MFEALILAVEGFVQAYGLLGTFIVAFTESIIVPIPTATIVSSATTFGADPILVTIIATIGSVLGAIVGYYLGVKLGRPVAKKYFGKHIPRVEAWFQKYGAWAVFIAAFTPIPFKVFAWMAGITKVNMKYFILASIAGRFLQFLLAAYVGALLGPWFLSLFGYSS